MIIKILIRNNKIINDNRKYVKIEGFQNFRRRSKEFEYQLDRILRPGMLDLFPLEGNSKTTRFSIGGFYDGEKCDNLRNYLLLSSYSYKREIDVKPQEVFWKNINESEFISIFNKLFSHLK